MTAYLVEYRRPAGPSWWASSEGVTLEPRAAARMSHAEALDHVRRTLAAYPAEGLKARVALARRVA
jgi:hypothetical protein